MSSDINTPSSEEGYCHYCGTKQPVHVVTDEQAARIAEEAQCNEDYYLVDDHINPRTGQKCEGVDKSPESLIVGKDDDFYTTADEELPEEDGLEDQDWPEGYGPSDFI